MTMKEKGFITLALRRMVVEHNICTMVQLTAEDPDNFKYWSTTDLPDSEVDFGAMKVTLVRTTGATLKLIKCCYSGTHNYNITKDILSK